MAAMMLCTLSWMTVVGPVPRGPGGQGPRSQILRLDLIDSGMNTAMDQICAGYDDKDLQILADFLHRTADAARTAPKGSPRASRAARAKLELPADAIPR